MSEIYKDCIGISTNGTRPQNTVDFSTIGGEHCKTYVKLHDCINEKNRSCRSKTMTINLNPPRSGKTYILKLEKQLQAHKDKEDKLREFLEDETLLKLNKNCYEDSYKLQVYEIRKDILQILDGSDS